MATMAYVEDGSLPCPVNLELVGEMDVEQGEPIMVEAIVMADAESEPALAEPALVKWPPERVDQRLGAGAAARGWRVEEAWAKMAR